MAFLQLPDSPGGYLSGPIIPCRRGALQWGGEARQIQKIPAVANSREEKYKGNTAQFPPYGLSTAPAAAARHLRCQNAR